VTRLVMHLAQDSDTSGFFPQLATWHDRYRFRMVFGTLGLMDPRLRAHMEGEGVACFDLGCVRRSSYPRGLARLLIFLRRARVDVLHTHLFDPSVVGLTGGWLARTPLRVVTRHYSDYHTRIRRPLHVWLDRLCTRMSHRVIAVSMHTAGHLIDVEGAPPAKVSVIHNGIDFSRVRVSSPEAPGRLRVQLDLVDKRVVLMAARMHPEKGYEHLLAALPRVLARVPNLVLLIAGTGSLEARYRYLSASLGLGSCVQFLGFRRDLPDVMAASDLVVLPSLAEAFGLVVAEALYLGVPVVASRVGGIPEIVEDGIDGLLVAPGDDEALAGALTALLLDDERRCRLRGAGREKVTSRFGFRHMVAAYERLYDEQDGRRA
jgi:glycosyltransferase involved in cell wall biosynthesis